VCSLLSLDPIHFRISRPARAGELVLELVILKYFTDFNRCPSLLCYRRTARYLELSRFTYRYGFILYHFPLWSAGWHVVGCGNKGVLEFAIVA
jgi:hypothetical protein